MQSEMLAIICQNRHVGFYQTEKLQYSKENGLEGRQRFSGPGEYIFKSTFDKELLSQNIMNTNSPTVSKQIACLRIDKRPE